MSVATVGACRFFEACYIKFKVGCEISSVGACRFFEACYIDFFEHLPSN